MGFLTLQEFKQDFEEDDNYWAVYFVEKCVDFE